jgi:hypothetical protein
MSFQKSYFEFQIFSGTITTAQARGQHTYPRLETYIAKGMGYFPAIEGSRLAAWLSFARLRTDI